MNQCLNSAIRNATGHYYLNGNFQVLVVSDLHPIAGTIFTYETRSDKTERLYARGPTKEDLIVQVGLLLFIITSL